MGKPFFAFLMWLIVLSFYRLNRKRTFHAENNDLFIKDIVLSFYISSLRHYCPKRHSG